jgi:hypothetical protein
VEQAREMAPLLDDPDLHVFIGGRPASLAELQQRYREAGDLTAEVAWVVATPYQGREYAREAVEVMVTLLWRSGVARVVAHIHPQHKASAVIARAINLAPTANTTWVAGRGPIRAWLAAGARTRRFRAGGGAL